MMAVGKHDLGQNLEILTALDACFAAKSPYEYENAYARLDDHLEDDHSDLYQLFEFTELQDTALRVYDLLATWSTQRNVSMPAPPGTTAAFFEDLLSRMKNPSEMPAEVLSIIRACIDAKKGMLRLVSSVEVSPVRCLRAGGINLGLNTLDAALWKQTTEVDVTDPSKPKEKDALGMPKIHGDSNLQVVGTGREFGLVDENLVPLGPQVAKNSAALSECGSGTAPESAHPAGRTSSIRPIVAIVMGGGFIVASVTLHLKMQLAAQMASLLGVMAITPAMLMILGAAGGVMIFLGVYAPCQKPHPAVVETTATSATSSANTWMGCFKSGDGDTDVASTPTCWDRVTSCFSGS
ncbi:MAG: hypothetical protein NXI01_01305 [Gammaproteobacteria bacterium]|nr:hypothetical protein [Gammaproteobacteria bacterium]